MNCTALIPVVALTATPDGRRRGLAARSRLLGLPREADRRSRVSRPRPRLRGESHRIAASHHRGRRGMLASPTPGRRARLLFASPSSYGPSHEPRASDVGAPFGGDERQAGRARSLRRSRDLRVPYRVLGFGRRLGSAGRPARRRDARRHGPHAVVLRRACAAAGREVRVGPARGRRRPLRRRRSAREELRPPGTEGRAACGGTSTPEEADTQADVFVRQGVDVIVAFEDKSIAAAQKATAGMAASDSDRLPAPVRPGAPGIGGQSLAAGPKPHRSVRCARRRRQAARAVRAPRSEAAHRAHARGSHGHENRVAPCRVPGRGERVATTD